MDMTFKVVEKRQIEGLSGTEWIVEFQLERINGIHLHPPDNTETLTVTTKSLPSKSVYDEAVIGATYTLRGEGDFRRDIFR